MTELPSGTVTFLFTDIEGSTELLKRLGDRYAGILDDHRRLLREAFTAHGGREIDTQGDSFFYAFARAKHGIAAAIDGQRALTVHEWPEGVELRVRMGLHSGEPLVGEERYVGIGVNRAARIGAAAHGGQVLVSDSTRALVEDDMPEGIYLRDLGLWRLKDIDRPERVSQVVAKGLQVDFPPLRGAEPERKAPLRRRSMLAAALVGVVAAAVAVPVFALSGGGSGGSVASASIGANSVGVLDASNGRPLASSSVGSTPGALVADGDSVWVGNPDSDSVSRIDAKTHVKTATIPVGSDPAGIAVGGGFVWVANALAGTVSKIDPNANGGSGAMVDTIPVGNGPSGIAFGSGRLWVANSTDRTVMESWLFPHPADPSRPWSDSMYRNWRKRVFAPAAQRAGHDDLVPYDLRRTFVSLLLSCGYRRGEVADQAGHSLAVMEGHYAVTIAEYRGVALADPAKVIQEARAARVLQRREVARNVKA